MKSVKIILIVFSVLILFYSGNFIFKKINWEKRVAFANVSDLYGKKTNGISNDELINKARDFIELSKQTLSSSISNFDSAWFKAHAPELLYFTDNKYNVVWRFVPGCEKEISSPYWLDKNGNRCLGGQILEIKIDETLKPQMFYIKKLK